MPAPPTWDPDVALQWPPPYHALIGTYACVFAGTTGVLLLYAIARRPRACYAYATGVSALCAAAMYVRYARPERFYIARLLDLWLAEATLGMCMRLLDALMALVAQTDRGAWPHRPAWQSYMRVSHIAWACSGLTVRSRLLYSLMYLLVCLQWGLYATTLHRLRRALPVSGCAPAPTPTTASRMAASLLRLPRLHKVSPHTLVYLHDLLGAAVVLCVQLMFLVIYTYAEELRDFHAWIVHTTRLFSLVFLGLLMAPGLVPRFSASSYRTPRPHAAAARAPRYPTCP